MLEKEIKILEINKENLITKLEEIWAEKIFDWIIHDIYYDFIDWEKRKLEENQRIFRVRKKWEIHIYTIKRKRLKEWAKEWLVMNDEYETQITNPESFWRVLEKYWMTKTREKIKHRTSYKMSDAEFDIDEYEEIPIFLEIEASSAKIINNYIKKLDLKNNPTLIWGSRKLFKYYNKEYKNL